MAREICVGTSKDKNILKKNDAGRGESRWTRDGQEFTSKRTAIICATKW